ncbi:MAG: hypothetical protein FIB08_03880 [Candidatus Methanoperedens sp.]|nr:hypothetical protein [Candidatus Methanoperedens sp.]
MNIYKKIGLLLIVFILSNIIYGYFINIDNESEKISLNESERIPDDEYEVISSFFIPQGTYPQSAKLVIEQLTTNDKVGDSSFNGFENYTKIKLDASLIDDFKKKNANTYKLENKFSIQQKVVIISEKKRKDIFRDDVGWLRFYMNHPGSYSGIHEISRVGFNDNKTQALFYHGFQLDGDMAQGNLILLTKENGKWIIKAYSREWIA